MAVPLLEAVGVPEAVKVKKLEAEVVSVVVPVLWVIDLLSIQKRKKSTLRATMA